MMMILMLHYLQNYTTPDDDDIDDALSMMILMMYYLQNYTSPTLMLSPTYKLSNVVLVNRNLCLRN